MKDTPFGQGYIGRCIPCGDMRGLGQAPAAAPAIHFDLGRDLTAASVAFTGPILYHYAAPKKWKRFGALGNVVAVVGLYLSTAWAYGRIQQARGA
jgi:hypothetical protein